MKFNPWAGPTVVGDLAIVGCSSIRLEPKDLAKAQGEVVAISLADGTIKWRRELPAGIVSTVAVKDQLAVFTGTDGKVRAWEIQTGQEKWSVDGNAPYFAGPAIAGNAIYVADLKGVVRAIALDGKPIWTFNLATDPAVQAPGMVYGSPVVSGGRLFVATCNIESGVKSTTVVVCLGNNTP